MSAQLDRTSADDRLSRDEASKVSANGSEPEDRARLRRQATIKLRILEAIGTLAGRAKDGDYIRTGKDFRAGCVARPRSSVNHGGGRHSTMEAPVAH